MKQQERHDRILERLDREGSVSTSELTRELDVNIVTIRRDLAALEQTGALQRMHGGAVASRLGRIEFAFREDQQACAREKQAIGAAAAGLIVPGMTIALDTGTTTLAVARAIGDAPGLKVLTSSLAVAATLYPRADVELVLLGGIARSGSPDLYGMLTEDNIRHFHVDVAFLGADAVTREGACTTDMRTARVSQALIDSADESILLADHTKFDRASFVRIAGWDRIRRVITDQAVNADTRAWLEERAAAVQYGVPGQAH